jgi:prepilin-type N-terminal cleavage/methylation domain-containing protein
MKSNRWNRGFSLLELLIVVAIILIIATIAIPSLLRSRQSANESSAVAHMRTINTAQVNYASNGGLYGSVPELVGSGQLDSRFAGSMSGYSFTIDLAGNRVDYTAYATATGSNMGRYDYYTTPDYIVRFSTNTSRAPAGMEGAPVQ